MVDDVALGVLATASGAGIAALLLLARAIRGAVRVEDTLRATALVGIAEVIPQALAGSGSVPLDALGIGATRRGLARIDDLHVGHYGLALGEGIPGQAGVAHAHGLVGDHAAQGTDAAQAGTGIATLLIDAGQVRRALRVGHALGLAVGRRAHKLRQAGAGGSLSDSSALRIRSTWGWTARILGHDVLLRRLDNLLTAHEGISRVAGQAGAEGIVVHDAALSIAATGAGTGIDALLVDARQPGLALGVRGALRPAEGRRSKVSGHAGAHGLLVDLATLRVGAARRGLTGLDNGGGCKEYKGLGLRN